MTSEQIVLASYYWIYRMKGFKLFKMIKVSIYPMFTLFILYYSDLKNKKVEFTFFFCFLYFK